MAAVNPTKATRRRIKALKLSHESQSLTAISSPPVAVARAVRKDKRKTARVPRSVTVGANLFPTGMRDNTAAKVEIIKMYISSIKFYSSLKAIISPTAVFAIIL
jgi:hypothetical protein